MIWGNQQLRGGRLTADASAWSTDVTWGALTTPVVRSSNGAGSARLALRIAVRPVALGRDFAVNVVWGPTCDGADCDAVDGQRLGTNDEGDTVVWGTSDEGDTVVWGTSDDGDTVVWGTGDEEDTVVWGTSCSAPIVNR